MSEMKTTGSFSIEQANKMLPLVSAIVNDVVQHFGELCERQDRLAMIRQNGSGSTDPYREEMEEVDSQLRSDLDQLQSYLDELQELGVEFKDFSLGLVDFPTEINGEKAYLCWKLGEPTVSHWHSLNAGFSGRQTLQDSLLTVGNQDSS